MIFYDITTKNLVSTDTTVERTLRCWIATIRPAQGLESLGFGVVGVWRGGGGSCVRDCAMEGRLSRFWYYVAVQLTEV